MHLFVLRNSQLQVQLVLLAKGEPLSSCAVVRDKDGHSGRHAVRVAEVVGEAFFLFDSVLALFACKGVLGVFALGCDTAGTGEGSVRDAYGGLGVILRDHVRYKSPVSALINQIIRLVADDTAERLLLLAVGETDTRGECSVTDLKTPADGLAKGYGHTIFEGALATAALGVGKLDLLSIAPFEALFTKGFALDGVNAVFKVKCSGTYGVVAVRADGAVALIVELVGRLTTSPFLTRMSVLKRWDEKSKLSIPRFHQ